MRLTQLLRIALPVVLLIWLWIIARFFYKNNSDQNNNKYDTEDFMSVSDALFKLKKYEEKIAALERENLRLRMQMIEPNLPAKQQKNHGTFVLYVLFHGKNLSCFLSVDFEQEQKRACNCGNEQPSSDDNSGAPSFEYESSRREVKRGVDELWRLLRDQLKGQNDKLVSDIRHRYLAIQSDLGKMREHDGYEGWRHQVCLSVTITDFC